MAKRLHVLAFVRALVWASATCQPKGQGACRGNQKTLTLKDSAQVDANNSIPAFVEWSANGDPRLILGSDDGTLTFLEYRNGSWQQLTGADNPFHGISVSAYSAPAVVDWDQDGDLDLILGSNSKEEDPLAFWERLPGGGWRQRTGLENPFHNIRNPGYLVPAVVDWDQDGDQDLILGSLEGTLAFFERLPDGSCHELTGSDNPFHGFRVALHSKPVVADWDGDGDDDVIVGGFSGQLAFLERWPDGSVQQVTGAANPFHRIDVGRFSAPAVADLDQDGDVDLILSSGEGTLELWEHRPADNWQQVTGPDNPFYNIRGGLGSPVPVIVDWDQDGHLDFIAGPVASEGNSSLEELGFWKGRPDGSWQQLVGTENPFHSMHGVLNPVAADWDRDGDLDLIVRTVTQGHLVLAFWERELDGSLRQVTGTENPFRGISLPFLAALAVVDWDADGDLDLIVSGPDQPVWAFWEHLPDGSLQELSAGSHPFPHQSVAATVASRLAVGPVFVDFDLDGDLDLVTGSRRGTLEFWERRPDGSLEPLWGSDNPFCSVNAEIGVRAWTSPVVVDLDRDGDLDLVVAFEDGTLAVWERAGCTVASPCLGSGLCSAVTSSCLCFLGYSEKDCSSCEAGFYLSRPRHCEPCPPGKTSDSGESVCTQCEAGRYSLNASASCLLCAAGTEPSAGREACQACSEGKHSVPGGVCQICPAGTEPSSARDSCIRCPTSSYAVAGMRACEACEAGYVQTVEGSGCELRLHILIVINACATVALACAALSCVCLAMQRETRRQLRLGTALRDAEKLKQGIRQAERFRVRGPLLQAARNTLHLCLNKYTSLDYLLEVLGEGDLKLLKGSWLASEENLRLRRQQDIPTSAFWTLEELRAEQQTVLFAAVSYCWLHPLHPDPQGEHLSVLRRAVQLRLQVTGPGSITDMAIFLDYCSLPQNAEDGTSRDQREKESFRRGLKQVNILYGNQHLDVWVIKWVPEKEMRKYDMRGWPCFEQAVSSIIKDSSKLHRLDEVTSCRDWLDIWATSRQSRRPPMTPARFSELIEQKTFTNGKTDTDFVKQKYAEAYEEQVARAQTLWFVHLGWNNEDAERLTEILPDCRCLTKLILAHNEISTEGARALTVASKVCPSLKVLDLAHNDIPTSSVVELQKHWTASGKETGELVTTGSHDVVAF